MFKSIQHYLVSLWMTFYTLYVYLCELLYFCLNCKKPKNWRINLVYTSSNHFDPRYPRIQLDGIRYVNQALNDLLILWWWHDKFEAFISLIVFVTEDLFHVKSLLHARKQVRQFFVISTSTWLFRSACLRSHIWWRHGQPTRTTNPVLTTWTSYCGLQTQKPRE